MTCGALPRLADQQAILRPVNIDEFPLLDRIAVAILDHRGEENG
jgi:hypothetical protein